MLSRVQQLVGVVLLACSGCSQNITTSPSSESATPMQAAKDKQGGTSTEPISKPVLRKFEFHYAFRLNKVSDGSRIRMWIPVPRSSKYQIVKEIQKTLPDGKATIGVESRHGNTILYVEPTVSDEKFIDLDIAYQIQRSEILVDQLTVDDVPKKTRELYLAANRRVPIDGDAVELIAGVERSDDTFQLARIIYDRVGEHMRYDKSQPGYGNGDSEWACQNGFGNCTDFHSLFIALARSQSLPGRFEIGFPLPSDKKQGEIGGYHCWAFFHDSQVGWVPTDISEADKHPELKEYYFGNLTANRVAFTTGRDIDLVPKQESEPLNFFIYPHIEINGKACSKEDIDLKFRFRDIGN